MEKAAGKAKTEISEMNSFEDSVLRVLRGDSVVGAAFLVSDRLVATCAHVVKSAGSEVGGKISLRLSDGKGIEAAVEPEFWRDEQAEDISILILNEPLENIRPVILGLSTGTKGHNFSTSGFPSSGQVLAGGGVIIGQATINGIKLLQLRSPEVTPGFSGAPVFDETTKRIVGMVVAITPLDEYQRLGTTAFAIPSETIREICPELQISDICPYRSLDVFNEEDAPFFFGRECVVQKMIDSLKREPRFLAVLGPSGSGKSSVVRAGLIPALKQGKVLGSDNWGVILIRPTNQPFEQLDGAGLARSQEGLEGAVHTWLEDHPEKTRLIMIVDQFEEALVSTPEDMRQKFINELARLLNSPVAITFVLTLRDDFYGRFLQYSSILTNWLEHGLVNIPPMLEQDELRAIVIGPTKQVGLSFEEGLVDVILADAVEADRTKGMTRSTILPLLEFALTQLWEKRWDGRLTHDAYRAIDGVTGGLSQWANQTYYDLNPEEREIARHILSELVRPGNEEQGIPDTRRVRPLTNLMHDNQILSQRVIDRLIHMRLLSTWRDEETGLEKIEIIHDALLREWGLLRDWMTKNRIFLAWRDGLETQIRKWEENNQNEVALLRGLPLVEAEGWLDIRKDELSAIGQQFIDAGIELREKERAEKERLYKRSVQMETLLSTSRIIASGQDTNLLLAVLVDQITEMLHVDAVWILLLNQKTNLLELVAGKGSRSKILQYPRLKLGEGYAGRVAAERKMLNIPDLRKNKTEFDLSPFFEKEDFIVYHGVPLIASQRVLGVLEIFHRSMFQPDADWLKFLNMIVHQAEIAIDNAVLFREVQRANPELRLAYDATFEALSQALDLRDKETKEPYRVTNITVKLATRFGIGESDLVHIRRGALLHDIGNLGVPDSILLKPGALTEEEWKIIRRHPTYAYEMLQTIDYRQHTSDIPYCHHEKWDGTGYPRALQAEEIPLVARIFAVADVYTALSSDRPYRPAWSAEEALKYIKDQSGKQFDPKIVEAFLNMISK